MAGFLNRKEKVASPPAAEINGNDKGEAQAYPSLQTASRRHPMDTSLSTRMVPTPAPNGGKVAVRSLPHMVSATRWVLTPGPQTQAGTQRQCDPAARASHRELVAAGGVSRAGSSPLELVGTGGVAGGLKREGWLRPRSHLEAQGIPPPTISWWPLPMR